MFLRRNFDALSKSAKDSFYGVTTYIRKEWSVCMILVPKRGFPRGKRDGVIGHISEFENRKLNEIIIIALLPQRDWVNLT